MPAIIISSQQHSKRSLPQMQPQAPNENKEHTQSFTGSCVNSLAVYSELTG